jgi:putative protease
MNSRPELVAPAQDWNVLKIVKGLADAVYLGVENFNMRKKARNFESKDLNQIADFCHNQNQRQNVYLSTNILIYDSELKQLEDLISKAKKAGIDAIIAHDLAAIKIAKKYNMKFHISTQANISNIESAIFYEELGADRIILARELSLRQIQNIKNQLKKTKIECFVHGAMCTSISGRCYFSATVCDSEEYSANRGNCIQPCRRQWKVIDDENNEFIYDGQQFLNAKDLCTIEFIPDLINANIDAFKIEGRMKDPLYVKTVVECYKNAIDSYYNGTYNKEKVEDWLRKLSEVYNLGFHMGFYFHRPTLEDIELNNRGNISPFKKTYFGKILTYDQQSKSANVLIENRELFLKVGDEIIIIGKNSYYIERVKTIIYKGVKVKSIKRDKNSNPIEFNLPLDCEVGTGDQIYIITKTKF